VTAKTFGFFKDRLPRGNASSSTYPQPEYNITTATSNVAQANIADTITFLFDTNLPNKTVYWTVSNTSVSTDFVDGITSGNFLLDSFGNATFTKTINTSSLENINKNFNFIFSHNDPLTSEPFFVKQANVNTVHTISESIIKLSGNGVGKIINTTSTYENPGQNTLLRFTAGIDNGTNQYGISSDEVPSNYTLSLNTFNNTNVSIDYLLVAAGGTEGGQNFGTSRPPNQSSWGTGGGAGGDVKDGTTVLSNSTVYNLTVSNARTYTYSPNTISIQNQVPISATNNTSAFDFSVSPGGYGGSFYQYVFLPQFSALAAESNRGGGGHATGGSGGSKIYTLGTYSGGSGSNQTSDVPGILTVVAGGGGAGAGGNGGSASAAGGIAQPGNAGIGYTSNVTGVAVAYGVGGPGVGGADGGSTRIGSRPLAPGATVNGLNGSGDGRSGVIYVKYKPYQKNISI
jgi:hypothetical protein